MRVSRGAWIHDVACWAVRVMGRYDKLQELSYGYDERNNRQVNVIGPVPFVGRKYIVPYTPTVVRNVKTVFRHEPLKTLDLLQVREETLYALPCGGTLRVVNWRVVPDGLKKKRKEQGGPR